MAKRKKHWSKLIEEAGVQIRIYERPNSSRVWYSVVQAARKIRRSLNTGDHTVAEERARAIAQELALVRLSGAPVDHITLGRLTALYLDHQGPLLSERRRRFQEVTLSLFRAFLGDDFRIEDFGQHQADFVRSETAFGVLPA